MGNVLRNDSVHSVNAPYRAPGRCITVRQTYIQRRDGWPALNYLGSDDHAQLRMSPARSVLHRTFVYCFSESSWRDRFHRIEYLVHSQFHNHFNWQNVTQHRNWNQTQSCVHANQQYAVNVYTNSKNLRKKLPPMNVAGRFWFIFHTCVSCIVWSTGQKTRHQHIKGAKKPPLNISFRNREPALNLRPFC